MYRETILAARPGQWSQLRPLPCLAQTPAAVMCSSLLSQYELEVQISDLKETVSVSVWHK